MLPERLLESGYRFAHPDLETALRHVLGEDRRAILPR
jgi:NAD dependent epimerase/dehydratase family enzyme